MNRRFGPRSPVLVALRLAVAVALLAGALPAVALGAGDTLDAAREHVKNAEYDEAILLLKDAIEAGREQLPPASADELRSLYLLLIKTYVVRSNASKFEPQGLETSRLYLDAARRTTEECLSIRALRTLRPDPGGDYPPEMFAVFNEVVADIFGSLRVSSVAPAQAAVTLDGDTLRAGADGVIYAPNLPVGEHHIAVGAPGHEDVTEVITVSPNVTLERAYALEKNKGFLWYASRGAVIVGGATALVLIGKGGGSDDTPPEPLPGPPGPPASGGP